MFSRRRFLAGLIPTLALLSAGATWLGYRRATCPLAQGGLCEGPCSAQIDANGNLLCDRVEGAVIMPVVASDPVAGPVDSPSPTALPKAPTAGGRRRRGGRGSDPLAPDSAYGVQPAVPEQGGVMPVDPTPAPQIEVRSLCPYGLVNDPYPGRCRRYVDTDGDGICDLSRVGGG